MTYDLATMTPQQLQQFMAKPSREEIERAFRSHTLHYTIDVESDSSIQGDRQKNQAELAAFTQSFGALIGAVGPLVQQGSMPEDVAVELFAATARKHRLGRQPEDALDRWADQVRKRAGQPKPPTPEQQKVMAEAQTAAVTLQLKRDELGLKAQEAAFKAQLEQQKAQHEAMLREQEFQHEQRLAELKASQEMQIRAAQAEADARADQTAAALRHQQLQEHAQQRSMRALAALERQLSRDEADAIARQGRKRRVKITRGADGRMEGAEIED